MRPQSRQEKIDFILKYKQGIVDKTGVSEKFEIDLDLSGKYKIDGLEVTQDEWIDWAARNRNPKGYYVTMKI